MRRLIHNWLVRIWYDQARPPWLLRSLAWLYEAWLSRQPDLPELNRYPFPVIVIGNVVVGGSGKTPLVIHLARLLIDQGMSVVVIARIYRGRLNGPLQVGENTSVGEVGDEPALLAGELSCPVVVSRNRSKAIEYIVKNKIDCDIVLSDDGFQHNALPRAMEIAVIDSRRNVGNGMLLPAGPLREPVTRLQRCQWLVEKVTGGGSAQFKRTIPLRVALNEAVHLHSGQRLPLSVINEKYQAIQALAAIADPDAFFETLNAAGVDCTGHRLPDHEPITATTLARFRDASILLMTSKDAVKCRMIEPPLENAWYVPLETSLPESFETAFVERCRLLSTL